MSQQQRHNKQDQDGPPTLADIVREKTNDGQVIVDFYLDVVQGKRDDEGFEACHKMEAAMQVHAVAPEVVADAIERLTGVECHPDRRGPRPKKPSRRPRASNHPSCGDEACPLLDTGGSRDIDILAANTRRRQVLRYLAEALAAPALADDPRVTDIVRESTDHGKSAVSFLLHVMYGTVRGFRPYNRMEAARELIGHIARDELRTQNDLTVVPAKAGTQKGGAGEGLSSPSPSTGEGRGEGDSPVIPAKAGIQNDGNLTVVPAKAGTQKGRAGEGLSSPSPSTGEGRGEGEGGGDESAPATAPDAPKSVRPEPVEEPALSLPKGQCSANSTVPGPAETDAEADDQETHRGIYDLESKVTEAEWDPSHPIHKFVDAYEEIAKDFRRQDEANDNDEEVRKWISGETPDTHGRYIWQYTPANPRINRLLRPERRRSRSSKTPFKPESIWGKPMLADRIRAEGGEFPPRRPLIWV